MCEILYLHANKTSLSKSTVPLQNSAKQPDITTAVCVRYFVQVLYVMLFSTKNMFDLGAIQKSTKMSIKIVFFFLVC